MFALIVTTGIHPALPDTGVYKWVLAIFSFLSAGFLLLLFRLLKTKRKLAFYLTVAFLLLIATLTIMDDLGVVDFLVLAITLLPVILLIKNRKWYLNKSDSS